MLDEGHSAHELRLKHLDDIGAVIGRLSHQSFIIRGWSVTLVSVVLVIIGAQEHRSDAPILLALFPTFIFWGLDAYYLRQERLFRRLYATVGRRLADGDGSRADLFDMNFRQQRHEVQGLARTMVAGNVLAIPVMLVCLIVGYAVVNR
jgi:hypothetical protein